MNANEAFDYESQLRKDLAAAEQQLAYWRRMATLLKSQISNLESEVVKE